MAQNKALNKPRFVKIKDLQTHRSGYNVYAKVISAQPKTIDTKEGLKIPMVDCILADQTGSAKAFFKGENAKIIQKGNVVAVRNGLKRFIKDHISLEVDLFGRVTLEKDVTINANEEAKDNISSVEHKLEPRQRRQGGQGRRPQGGRGGPRRDNDRPRRNDDRPRRNDDRPRRNDDRPRREDGDRPRRNDDRPRREDREERPRREDREERPRREDREDRGDRRDRNLNNRQNQDRFDRRREEVPRRYNRDRDYDRREDREERGERKPRAQYAEKREDYTRGERKPLKWTKLADIGPADDGLSLLVKVLTVTKVGGRSSKYRCVIADSTGCAKAFLPDKMDVREGDSIVLFNAKAEVVNEHIEIQLDYNGGRMETARRPVEKISEEFDLSSKAWVPIE